MNKTLTVNIGGLVFHIEEHAYEKLRKYLDAIKGYFTSSDGRDEIIQDVESRIAEMFNERIKDNKQVIIEEDVEHVINVMGRPEQFAGDEASGQKTYAANIEEQRSYRRLYRDPDDRIIAGVCSGLSQRLNIDPLWIRLIFVLIVFVGGGGILLYIILAIVIPKAVTTSQKLEMRGESVTVGNIRKAVEEPVAKKETTASRIFDTIGGIIRAVLKFFIYIIGGFIALVGILVLFALFIALLATMGVAGISIPIYISDLFLSSSQQFWVMLSLLLIIGTPVVMLIYAGIKMLFRIKARSRAFNITIVVLQIIGWIIGFYMLAIISRDFSQSSRQRTEISLVSAQTDTMFVDVLHDRNYSEDDDSRRYHIGFMFGRNMSVTTGDEGRMIPENVTLDIQKSQTDKFELVQIKSARGATEKVAYENASAINYNFEQQDSLLKFSRYFPLSKETKYRDQRVKLILKVPVGKSVHLNQDSEWIIYDIKNVTNTYDGDMIGKTWTMTERGFECIGCGFENEKGTYYYGDDDEWSGGDAKVKIDKHGIHIKASDGRDTVHYRGKDVDIKIDENGVVIDAEK